MIHDDKSYKGNDSNHNEEEEFSDDSIEINDVAQDNTGIFKARSVSEFGSINFVLEYGGNLLCLRALLQPSTADFSPFPDRIFTLLYFVLHSPVPIVSKESTRSHL